MNSEIVAAIQEKNMIFVSAQPDQTYFHWQVELYLYQFSKHNIQDRCYAVFGYHGDKPSAYVTNLAKKYNVIAYKDERKQKTYIPSIRPHLLAKFFKEHPELGKNVFYHDSDIFLVKLPRFDILLQDESVSYLSDTISYIGYNYIKDCGKRYKEKYPELPEDDIFQRMVKLMDIDPALVQSNEKNSGGAQYLLKDIDAQYWQDVETSCVNLYDAFLEYDTKYKLGNPIQKWTADMWAVLWTYWKRGKSTEIHVELDFSWATGTVNDYFSKNIFHLAGVTESTQKDKFFKGKYTSRNIFDEYIAHPNVFDHIHKNNATYEYISVMKEYVEEVYNKDNVKAKLPSKVKRFRLVSENPEGNVYVKDEGKLCCGKPIWRSIDTKFIIFFNEHTWVLTYSCYESGVKENSGGLAFCHGAEPYEDNWNNEYLVEWIDAVTVPVAVEEK